MWQFKWKLLNSLRLTYCTWLRPLFLAVFSWNFALSSFNCCTVHYFCNFSDGVTFCFDEQQPQWTAVYKHSLTTLYYHFLVNWNPTVFAKFSLVASGRITGLVYSWAHLGATFKSDSPLQTSYMCNLDCNSSLLTRVSWVLLLQNMSVL